MRRIFALAMLLQLAILAASPMNVLGEIFTEVCSGCGGDFSVARSALIQLSQERERLFPVIWNLTDPASPGALDRYNWYGATLVPHAVFGGVKKVEGEYDPLNDYYDAYVSVYEQESPLEIDIEAHRTDTKDMQIIAAVTVTGELPSAHNQAFFLVTKQDRSNYHGLVEAKSENVTVDLNGRIELEHVFEWQTGWDELEMRGLLVVQNMDSGQVLQAAECKITEVGVGSNNVPPVEAAVRVWPNPFNPETSIGFELPQAGQAQLDVYNVRGRKVATLAQGAFPAGHHEVVWRADGAGSGVYFAVLRTESGQSAQRMVLLK